MAAKNGLDILFRIFRDLLELVDNYQAALVGLLQEGENLFDSIIGLGDIAQLDVECRGVLNGVVAEAGTQRLQRECKQATHLRASRSYFLEHCRTKSVDKLAESGRMEYVYRDRDIVLGQFGLVEDEVDQ